MLKNIILIVATIVSATLLMSKDTYALEKVADSSAQIVRSEPVYSVDPVVYELKKLAIQRVLSRYNSTLVTEADAFVAASYKYNLDPYLLVSISGLESYFAHFMVDSTYNAYGWRGGWHYFISWDDGIETISKSLRQDYFDKGAQNIYDVGRKYAASPTWAVRVIRFMNEFEAEENEINSAITVTL